MVTAQKLPDETAISDIVTTLRAQSHLRAAGFTTLGHVRRKGLKAAMAVRYVGPSSKEELIAAIGPQGPDAVTDATREEAIEFEENGMPIHLERVPSGPSHMSWTPARKVTVGDSEVVQQSIFVEFDEQGHAEISMRMYLMRRYRRDESKVDDAIDEGRAWRNECVRMLRGLSQFGSGFIILDD
jgi:hypothetical protein